MVVVCKILDQLHLMRAGRAAFTYVRIVIWENTSPEGQVLLRSPKRSTSTFNGSQLQVSCTTVQQLKKKSQANLPEQNLKTKSGVAERFRDSEFQSILLRFMTLHRDIPLSVQVTVPQKDASDKRVAKLATEFGNYSSSLEKPAITVLSPLADIRLRLKSECNIFEVALMIGRELQSVRVKFYYEVSSKKKSNK